MSGNADIDIGKNASVDDFAGRDKAGRDINKNTYVYYQGGQTGHFPLHDPANILEKYCHIDREPWVTWLEKIFEASSWKHISQQYSFCFFSAPSAEFPELLADRLQDHGLPNVGLDTLNLRNVELPSQDEMNAVSFVRSSKSDDGYGLSVLAREAFENALSVNEEKTSASISNEGVLCWCDIDVHSWNAQRASDLRIATEAFAAVCSEFGIKRSCLLLVFRSGLARSGAKERRFYEACETIAKEIGDRFQCYRGDPLAPVFKKDAIKWAQERFESRHRPLIYQLIERFYCRFGLRFMERDTIPLRHLVDKLEDSRKKGEFS